MVSVPTTNSSTFALGTQVVVVIMMVMMVMVVLMVMVMVMMVVMVMVMMATVVLMVMVKEVHAQIQKRYFQHDLFQRPALDIVLFVLGLIAVAVACFCW